MRWKYFLLSLIPFTLVPVTLICLSYPPTIASQGIAHRIFYLHVPIAWVALYAPIIAAGSSCLYLWTRHNRYDIYSLAATRIAYIFAIAVLFSGPLWAATEWGSYWNWKDSRLISFFVLLLILSAYFIHRSMASSVGVQEKLGSSVIAILAALASILTWLAIRWMEPDTHPGSVLDKMSPKIRLSFWIAVLAYHLLFWSLLYLSIQKERIKAQYKQYLWQKLS